jgi:serine/threonine-protein kinase PpkA
MNPGLARMSILVVEDDEIIRNNLVKILRIEGYEPLPAPNGARGLEVARALKPDLVVTDVNMPELDGFGLLDALRADPNLADVPVIMLTALDDRASVRRGMTRGASDYISKPFSREELLEAVTAQCERKRRVDEVQAAKLSAAVAVEEEKLVKRFTESFSGRAHDELARSLPNDIAPDSVVSATVLFADIRGFTAISERLSAVEVAELLSEYFERICDPILKYGGHHLKFIGDGLMAVFSETMHGTPIVHARRALSSALGMAYSASAFREWMNERFPGRGLPPFAIGVGVHSGEVMFCRLGTLQSAEVTALGDTVNTAARLEQVSKELGWSIVASEVCVAAAGEGVQLGAHDKVPVRGREERVPVAEVVGLVTNREDKIHGMASLTERAAEIRAAVAANSAITARAVKKALSNTLAALSNFDGHPAAATRTLNTLALKGYRLLKKIGAGGMSQVFLAQRDNDSTPIVLKVIDTSARANADTINRFILEFALLSQIDHPHVARIYDQGFSDEHAYIAMEYFEGGDLRGLINSAMPFELALAILRQAALALEAIHARGVIHRDLKPDNLMVRSDGTIGLADFGIAKSVTDGGGDFNQTQHGEVLGTPYYLSPEQVSGGNITAQTDLYSLGVVLYEMLTGERPYLADTLDKLMAKHLTAPIPSLPTRHSAMQPVLNRLMAKLPEHRYPSASALLDDLTHLG